MQACSISARHNTQHTVPSHMPSFCADHRLRAEAVLRVQVDCVFDMMCNDGALHAAPAA